MNQAVRPRRSGELLRTTLIVSAAVGIVLGVVAIFWPAATLLSIATFLGVALVVAGIFRVVYGVIDANGSTQGRIVQSVLGVVLVVVGILVLVRPAHSLIFVALVIGVGWIITGVRDAVFGLRVLHGRSRVLAVVAGAVAIVGGVVMLTLPGLALSSFAVVAGILLIVVSIATLLTMPSRAANRS